jgi:hypothetical protein
VPSAGDADRGVTGRVGDTDAICFFGSTIDTDLVTVGDVASDAVHGARSVQQSDGDSNADPNPAATAAGTHANSHANSAAATAADPSTVHHTGVGLTEYNDRDLSLLLRGFGSGVGLPKRHLSRSWERERRTRRKLSSYVQHARGYRSDAATPGRPRIRLHNRLCAEVELSICHADLGG